MEEIALKIGKKHVIDCYKKNGTSLCSTSKSLYPRIFSKGGGNPTTGHLRATYYFCGYASQCKRLRRKL